MGHVGHWLCHLRLGFIVASTRAPGLFYALVHYLLDDSPAMRQKSRARPPASCHAMGGTIKCSTCQSTLHGRGPADPPTYRAEPLCPTCHPSDPRLWLGHIPRIEILCILRLFLLLHLPSDRCLLL